jgi:hypothetical protein
VSSVRANNYSSTDEGERNEMTLNEVFSAKNIMPSVVAGVVVAFIIAEKATTRGEEVRS